MGCLRICVWVLLWATMCIGTPPASIEQHVVSSHSICTTSNCVTGLRPNMTDRTRWFLVPGEGSKFYIVPHHPSESNIFFPSPTLPLTDLACFDIVPNVDNVFECVRHVIYRSTCFNLETAMSMLRFASASCSRRLSMQTPTCQNKAKGSSLMV